VKLPAESDHGPASSHSLDNPQSEAPSNFSTSDPSVWGQALTKIPIPVIVRQSYSYAAIPRNRMASDVWLYFHNNATECCPRTQEGTRVHSHARCSTRAQSYCVGVSPTCVPSCVYLTKLGPYPMGRAQSAGHGLLGVLFVGAWSLETLGPSVEGAGVLENSLVARRLPGKWRRGISVWTNVVNKPSNIAACMTKHQVQVVHLTASAWVHLSHVKYKIDGQSAKTSDLQNCVFSKSGMHVTKKSY